ncbi:MAG: 4a-hydroxytetrahydrobiopterin dehydratase [Nanoarchaeota archaeon]
MITLSDIQKRIQGLKNWSLEGNAIVKEYQFYNFRESIEFVNKVADIAEKLNHHPSILIEDYIVRLVLTTHSEHGLTEKDFNAAEEIDKI